MRAETCSGRRQECSRSLAMQKVVGSSPIIRSDNAVYRCDLLANSAGVSAGRPRAAAYARTTLVAANPGGGKGPASTFLSRAKRRRKSEQAHSPPRATRKREASPSRTLRGPVRERALAAKGGSVSRLRQS